MSAAGQVFAEDVHGVVRRVGGDGCAQLAERAGTDQPEQFRLRKDSPDQGAEPPCHARLRPLGTLQHGFGVEDRGRPVGRLRFKGQLLQDFQDPLADDGRIGPLGLCGQRVDGGAGGGPVAGRPGGLAVDGLPDQ